MEGSRPAWGSVRTLRSFDERFTAPEGGFASAEDYYARASAAPFLPWITVPCLVISSENDPFVPIEIFQAHRNRSPSNVRWVFTPRGGHLGYWRAAEPRFWAGDAVVSFVE